MLDLNIDRERDRDRALIEIYKILAGIQTDGVQTTGGSIDLTSLTTLIGTKGEGEDDLLTLIRNIIYGNKVKVVEQNPPLPIIIMETFDEGDLTDDDYTIVSNPATDIIGIGITNNSEENGLVLSIGSLNIPVKATGSFYGSFLYNSTITVTGTSLDFDAFVEGAYEEVQA